MPKGHGLYIQIYPTLTALDIKHNKESFSVKKATESKRYLPKFLVESSELIYI